MQSQDLVQPHVLSQTGREILLDLAGVFPAFPSRMEAYHAAFFAFGNFELQTAGSSLLKCLGQGQLARIRRGRRERRETAEYGHNCETKFAIHDSQIAR